MDQDSGDRLVQNPAVRLRFALILEPVQEFQSFACYEPLTKLA